MKHTQAPNRFSLEVLEPRILLSGAPLLAAAVSAPAGGVSESSLANQGDEPVWRGTSGSERTLVYAPEMPITDIFDGRKPMGEGLDQAESQPNHSDNKT